MVATRFFLPPSKGSLSFLLAFLAVALPATGQPVEVAKLVPSGATGEDQVGESAAISGGVAVLGTGSAWVFEEDAGGPGAWGEVARLEASGDVDAVALEGTLLAIGASLDDTGGTHAGSVFLYEKSDGEWVFVEQLQASDAHPEHHFGWAVDFDGDRLIVGAPEGGLGRAGELDAAYIFERDHGGPDEWGQAARLAPPDKTHRNGYAVALDGSTAVVGQLRSRPATVWVYEREAGRSGSWALVAELKQADVSGFGRALALEGDTLLVGAPDDERVWVYRRRPADPASWTEVALLEPADPRDHFGWSLALEGDLALVGRPLAGTKVGAAYLYHRHQGGTEAWGEVAILKSSDIEPFDELGRAVALDGGRAVVGACNEDSGQEHHFWCFRDGEGAGYVFELDTVSVWATGTCPGALTIHLAGAPAGSRVALLASPAAGETPAADPCRRVIVELEDPVLLGTATADADGGFTADLSAPPSACGVYLQAVALDGCQRSNLGRLP